MNRELEMGKENQVSAIQASILKELFLDGRKSEKEIAENTGLKAITVRNNFCKMQENGTITGATAHINYKIFGYNTVAHMLINVEPQQGNQLIKYLRTTPYVYAVYNRGVKGNIGVITILEKLSRLDDVKEHLKSTFPISEIKTAIWTDVKEINSNLAITPENRKKLAPPIDCILNVKKKTRLSKVSVDEIDKKIADLLAENGLIPFNTLAKQVKITPEKAKNRYKRLKDQCALKVTIQVNPNKIGYRALCIFFTVTSHENMERIIYSIARIPDIISIMKTAGDYDLQIYAMIQELDELLFIKKELGKIGGIRKLDIEILGFGEKWKKWPSPKQYISTF